ncbi:MAG: prepilin-type N-terminal cleavage/methylation domain-containing protein [Alphaproteobacteria bacterium]|nr:prepilin-type N-terminal cleavage/methylation domain-containing protein [Alphaproteobacteria bacterium]
MSRGPNDSGFTLLEILIALAVLGLLVAGLVQGMRTAFAMWSAQTRAIDDATDTDAAARVLRRLLASMQPVSPNGFAAGTTHAPVLAGEPTRAYFVGDLPSGLGESRRADVTIERRGDRVVLDWLPRDTTAGQTGPSSRAADLLRGVAALRFAYWQPGDAGGAWLDHWQQPTLPKLVRVQIDFDAGDRRRWPDLIAAPLLWTPAGGGGAVERQ